MRAKLFTGMVLAVMLARSAGAQTAAAPAPVETPAPAEVATPEAIVKAVYAVISGPAERPRDWAKMRGLFVAGGSLAAAGQPKDGGPPRIQTMTVDGYIARAGANMAKKGFFERGVTGKVWRYAHIASVDSPYESRHAPGEPAPFARGINHFTLFDDGTRWWVVSIYWEGESAAFPLPPEAEALLKAK